MKGDYEMGGTWDNLIGNKYGLLTVIERGENIIYPSRKTPVKQWRCRCECGNEIDVRTAYLKSGHTQSCGCLWGKTMIKHGMCHTRLYSIWQNMKARCENHKNYAGRGITVCDEWKNDFVAFRDWAIANGYSDELELDRKNNDGNYEPSNCRWVTRTENNRNKRTNHFLTYNGKTLTLIEWQELTGIPYQEIRRRLNDGKSIKDALTKLQKEAPFN